MTPPPTRTAALAAAAVTALVLAACGDSGDSGDAAPAAGSTSGDSSAVAADAFPVTVEHAFGETTIEAAPQRVATVAWANHEVPLALGVVPVGMSKATWGDDDGDGILPWVEEKLAELGGQAPVLFDETDGIDFEAVADTEPDVILAAYSGLTQEDYDTLSAIAPVVAYPELAWGTTLEQMVLLNSRAMGMAEAGEELADTLEASVEEAFDAHPELDETSVVFSYLDPNDLSQIGFYTTTDPRVGFLAEAGMEVPEIVEERSEASESFYDSISAEESDSFADTDLFVTYGDDSGAFLAQLQADPLLSTIPAIANGAVAVLPDSTPLAAAANPSPLSIDWGLADYLDMLSAAAGSA